MNDLQVKAHSSADFIGGVVKNAELWGINVADLSHEELVEVILDLATHREKNKVYHINLHALNIAYLCPRFRSSLSCAHLVFCDGVGVRMAVALIGQTLNYRNTPPDWLDELAGTATGMVVSLFLLGDEEGVALRSAYIMSERYPRLRIVGTHHGFFEKTGPGNDYVVSKINTAAPDILLVGMGMPLQEFWIDDNVDRLNAKVYLPIGAAFKWYAGVEKRAPRLITDNGLEWLSRLTSHPVKLFKRYVIGNPALFMRLAKTVLFKRKIPLTCKKPFLQHCSNKCEFFNKR
jgi:N-acetylglucosaminyldiphosphoundecaprenol N-acetyl-beta-D-mannosaminyltransferase